VCFLSKLDINFVKKGTNSASFSKEELRALLHVSMAVITKQTKQAAIANATVHRFFFSHELR
jgi:hypothetical protein